jgi:glycosyltransferase involved in cell wall biosynthesis
MTMRIAFDYQAFVVGKHGGISRLFVKLAEELAALGEDPRVFAEFHWNAYLRDLKPELVVGRFLKNKGIGRVWRQLDCWAGKRRMAQWPADIVHETYYRAKRTGPAGIPTVVTVYDMIHELFPQHFSPVDPTSALKRLAVERADRVICISEHTRKDLIELFGVPAAKVSVTHLAYERFPVAAPSSADAVGRPFLLYVGQRGGYKNFRRLAEAVASSARLRGEFDLVAFGGGGFSPAEQAGFAALGFGDGRIRQLGGDDGVLGHLYATAQAFVYPSIYEGFGLPPLEAMAHGCPVVSSNASCMPEVIGEAAEYFDPLDVAAQAHAIEAVVFNDQRRAELAALGTARLANFSWTRCAEETRQIYRDLLG